MADEGVGGLRAEGEEGQVQGLGGEGGGGVDQLGYA